MHDYIACPNCGAELLPKAKVCPECGSDENTGWSEETIYDGLDLHEDDEVVNARPSTSLFQNRTFLYIVLILTLLVFLWMYVL